MNITIKFETEKTDEGSFLHLIIESSEIKQRIDYINPLEYEDANDDNKLDILYDFLNKKIVNIVEINEEVKDTIDELEEKQADEALSRFEDENGGFLY